MVKIACIGIAVQDKIYYVDEIPTIPGKFVAKDYKEIGGGPAATAAVTIAKLGGSVDFIGRVGDDPTGKEILSELESYGVNTKLSKIYKNAQSSQSAILVDNKGERLIINYPSPDLLTEVTWLDDIDFLKYDAILADVRWHEGTEYCLSKAKKIGIPTVLDADITPQDITPLVALSSHAAFSESGLLKIYPNHEINMALQKADQITAGMVYVTLGSEGCAWIEKNKIKHNKGFKVTVIDTTGAGDVFHGAFAFAIASHYDIDIAVNFANAVAALKCTQPGGRAGIPNIEQVEDFLSKTD